MDHFAHGVEDMSTAIIPDIHGDAQDVTDIARGVGKETDALHGKIDAHERKFVAPFRGNKDRPFERNPSACSSFVHHTVMVSRYL